MAVITYADFLILVSQILQDTTNVDYPTTELDLYIPQGVAKGSEYIPRTVKELATITADSRNIALSDENRRNLLWVEKVEYPIDQDPIAFRNCTRWGDILSLEMSARPSSAVSAYLYSAKTQILQKAIGTSDTAGAIKTGAAAGVSSLALKSLGTGTINENTKLEIAGDATDYMVKATATIAGNEATVTITPELAANVLADAIVTLSLSSTLDNILAYTVAEFVAGLAAVNKAMDSIGDINVGSGNAPSQLQQWGNNKMVTAIQKLSNLAKFKQGNLYSLD